MFFSLPRFSVWGFLLCLLFLFALPDANAQVIWEETWEDYPLGVMDDNIPESKGWDARLGFGSGQWKIESDGNGNKYLSRLNKAYECCYWKGCRMLREETQSYDNVYYGFRFKFDSDFDFRSGGKLNGIIGGQDPSPGVPTDGSSGASVTLMWRAHPDGQNAFMHTYTYCENKDDQWGQRDTLVDSNGQMIKFVRNRWYNVVVKIDMNTMDVDNGRITVFLDGQKVMERDDYLFRSKGGTWGWHINQLIYFFGGNGPGWAPTRDSYVYEDDWIFSQSLPTHLMNGTTFPQAPTADIDVSATSGQAPLNVTFDGSGSVDYDGTISSYTWDFGDGSPTETGTSVSHTYTTVGTYAATLTVIDDENLQDTRTVSIVVSEDNGGSGGGGTPGCDLPAGWLYTDVGAVGIPGEVCYDGNDDQYTITASGGDIWNGQDQFGFVYRPIDGDAEVTVELNALQNTHSYAKGGVMMREDLSTDSKHSMLVMNQTQRALQYRRTKGGTTEPTSGSWIGPTYSHPTWLRLTRVADVFSAFISTDGSSWSLVDTVHISMKSSIYLGIALTSHNNSVLNTSVFSRLSYDGNGASGFPVELLDFQAEAGAMGVDLSWSTASELNNNFFSLERSSDGSVFEHLTHVDGQGTTQSVSAYTSTDEDPWDGLIYYRLSQTDYNGVKTYLSTIAYRNDDLFDDRFTVFPNPVAGDQFRLTTFGIPEETEKRVRVMDARGREVHRQTMEGTEVDIILPPSLRAGIYHVVVDYRSGMLGKSIIIE